LPTSLAIFCFGLSALIFPGDCRACAIAGFVYRDTKDKGVVMVGLWKGGISILVKCWRFSRSQGIFYSLVSGCLVLPNCYQCRSLYGSEGIYCYGL
jgi:hypothetical protein